MIIETEDAKAHLNQTLDNDDDLIGRLIAAAQDHVERLLGFKIEDTYGGDGQDPVPPALVEAVMQVMAHWYENREAVVIGVTNVFSLPVGVQDIIREYRNWSFDGDPD